MRPQRRPWLLPSLGDPDVRFREGRSGRHQPGGRSSPAVPPGRRLRDTHVLTVDDRTAVVTTLFDYPGGMVEGRQTQVWVRFPVGWRIVAAHVSEIPMT